jgi:CDGSH-type Zn-finger protein
MTNPDSGPTITISKNGPYVVTGNVPVAEQHIEINAAGESIEWKEGEQFDHAETFKLCRCGQSNTKPFCDGSHKTVSFDGEETAAREDFDDMAQVIQGPTLSLKDAEHLCAFARFCDPAGQVWNLVEQTDEEGPRLQFLHEAGHCPGGRLVAVENASGSNMEQRLPLSIGLVVDTRAKVNGPIWVRGGIPVIAADGFEYEVRNRIALCRCGRSSNKPYCDGSHAAEA